MNQIVIAAPCYNESVGGVVVLHKLCHILNELGYNSSLTTTLKLSGQTEFFILNENQNTKVATYFNPEKDIIIYPEIEPGNPFNGKNVVRWLLNDYHLPEKDNTISTWNETDYWLYYDDMFYDGLKEKNILHIRETKLDIFKNYNLERKFKACFTYRKNHHLKSSLPIMHPENSIEIPHIISDEDLVRIFNSCERFYSYDTETYLNELAALCGCKSIIVPYKDAKFNPTPRWGVAYGIENLQFALNTHEKLIETLTQQEINNYSNTKIAFEKIFKYFNL
jgi:hypothetical protein